MKWRALIGFVAVGLALGYFPELRETLGYPRYILTFMYFAFFWTSLATSWNILTGYSGYFSFGQGAFYGIGVYTTATIVTKTEWPFLVTLPLAGLLASLLGLLVGFVVFRLPSLRGELFALLTLAVDFVVASIILNLIDGGYGLSIGRVDYPDFLGDFSAMMFRLGLLIALMTIFAAYLVHHSRLGRGLIAIHDDEAVAEGLGVPTFRYKMIAFGLNTFFAGLAGGLHAVQLSYVEIGGVFKLTVPLFVILMSLLGGRRHWLGPLIGAVIIHTFNDAFSDTRFQLANDIAIGGLLIAIILFMPEGIYGRLRQRLIPSVLLAAIVVVIQALTVGGRITVQFAVVLLFVIVLLILPERFYQSYIGRFVPSLARLEMKAKVGAGE